MTERVQSFPLQWPSGFPRFKSSRTGGAFKTSFDQALENVRKSLEMFGRDSGKVITAPVLSSNVDFSPLSPRRDTRPEDPGVAVWFSWDGIQVCIAVDRYSTPAGNLQAIHHIIEARRTELRHGTLALVRATFQGFKALPAPSGKHWSDILEVRRDVNHRADGLEAQYKRLAKVRHPDAGGSAEAFAELQAAYTTAKQELGL